MFDLTKAFSTAHLDVTLYINIKKKVKTNTTLNPPIIM